MMEYETVHRSLPRSLTPVNTPKRDLQQMLMDKKTPLRDADRLVVILAGSLFYATVTFVFFVVSKSTVP